MPVRGEKKFSHDDVRRGVALYNEGASLRVAGELVGATHQMIKLWVLEQTPNRYRGYGNRLKDASDTGVMDKCILEAYRLNAEGVPLAEIADILDMSYDRVRNWLRLQSGREAFSVFEIEVPNVGALKYMTLDEARGFCLRAIQDKLDSVT